MHSTATSVQRTGQDTSVSCVAAAQGEEEAERERFILKHSVCNTESESSLDSDHQHSENKGIRESFFFVLLISGCFTKRPCLNFNVDHVSIACLQSEIDTGESSCYVRKS